MDIPDYGNRMLQRIGVIFFVAAIVILWICIFDHGKTFELILRLDESLGYRENENLYEMCIRDSLKTAVMHYLIS